MATYVCKNIAWDTDDPDGPEEPPPLPNSASVVIDDDEEMTDDDITEVVLDALSNKYGYCIFHAEISRVDKLLDECDKVP